MSVIGRLDEQVNDILIKPLSKERRETEEPPTPRPEEADPPNESADKDETAARHNELPVWLL